MQNAIEYDPVLGAYESYVEAREAFEAIPVPLETEEQQRAHLQAYNEMLVAEKAYRFELWAENAVTSEPW